MQKSEVDAEVGTDSTLESVFTNLPTNQLPNFPQHYVSMRITLPWGKWPEIAKVLEFSEFEWYISYPHKGTHRNNEHFHVFVPQQYPDDIPKRAPWIECIRKRFKVRLGLTGNGFYSLKCCSNGLDKAIQYGSREGTQPYTHGPEAALWCANAPAWVDLKKTVSTDTSSPKSKKQRVSEFGIPITCVNILHLAWRYRNEKMPRTNTLKEVVLRMLGDGYVFSPDIVRRGFPDFYNDCFQEFCYVEKFDWTKTNHGDWWSKVSRKFQ